MSLSALDDFVAHTGTAGPIEGVIRIEALLRPAPRVCTTSNRTGPTYSRRVCARGWRRAVVLTSRRPGSEK